MVESDVCMDLLIARRIPENLTSSYSASGAAGTLAGAAAALAMGIGHCIGGNLFAGFALIAACFVCAGLAIFFFFGCKSASKGALWLAKKMIFAAKTKFARKGDPK